VYENEYLLGTSLARPIISQGLVATAREYGADAISHGATGKGNDQVRFELSTAALAPDLKTIAPWREWDLAGRSDLMAYAEARGISVPVTREAPYSMDANLFHISYEGGVLEDPWAGPPADMFRMTVDPADAPDDPRELTIGFESGTPVSIDGKSMGPVELLAGLNEIGGRHGIGRVDIVENRFVGIKSRGVYETPGGTILHTGRRAVESIALDREVLHLRDDLMTRYARIVYNGFWFSPERLALQETMDSIQEPVTGEARLVLYKGSARVVGRRSPNSLYDPEEATFEADDVYRQADAEGFISLNALRIRGYGTGSKS
jgi:argininosuccinate synthase